MHIANSDKPVKFYSLDVTLAVGYKTNSKNAIAFRKWATKTLKEHITNGYTINENLLKEKEDLYFNVLEDIRKLSNENSLISNNEIIDLIKTFSSTWFNKMDFNFMKQITPSSLMAITLLIAESNPKDRDKMIGLVLLLLKGTSINTK